MTKKEKVKLEIKKAHPSLLDKFFTEYKTPKTWIKTLLRWENSNMERANNGCIAGLPVLDQFNDANDNVKVLYKIASDNNITIENLY